MGLPPFYTGVFRSYAHTNNLFYLKDESGLPQNLWANLGGPKVCLDWCNHGLFTVADLPTLEGKIDFRRLTILTWILIYFAAVCNSILENSWQLLLWRVNVRSIII